MDPPFVPAATPPPGVVADYEHPASWEGLSIGVVVTSATIMVIAVAIRVFTKLHIMRTFGQEDYLLILALLCGLTYNFLVLGPATIRAEHIWKRPLASIPNWFFFVNIISIMWPVSMMFAKWSLLAQLLRVFAVQRYTRLWWLIKGLIWITTVAWILVIAFCIFICTPREKIWNPEVPGHCFNIFSVYLACSAVNVVVNCGILAVTPVGVWTLKIKRTQKAEITAVFSVNALALGCSIGRLVASVTIIQSIDPTRDVAMEAFWASGELVFFILATVFPTMPRFCQWARGHGSTRRPTKLEAIADDVELLPPRKAARKSDPNGAWESGSHKAGGILRTVDVEVVVTRLS